MSVLSNDNSAWRAFEQSELTHSAAHYLMTIMHLRKDNGYARVTDVAEHLDITRAAASKRISMLKERNYIVEDSKRMLSLTEEGMALARTVERHFLVMADFFEDILNIPKGVALADACKLEHLLSPESAHAIFRLGRVLKNDKTLLDRLKGEVRDYQSDCNGEGECEMCAEYGGCIAEDAALMAQFSADAKSSA